MCEIIFLSATYATHYATHWHKVQTLTLARGRAFHLVVLWFNAAHHSLWRPGNKQTGRSISPTGLEIANQTQRTRILWVFIQRKWWLSSCVVQQRMSAVQSPGHSCLPSAPFTTTHFRTGLLGVIIQISPNVAMFSLHRNVCLHICHCRYFCALTLFELMLSEALEAKCRWLKVPVSWRSPFSATH